MYYQITVDSDELMLLAKALNYSALTHPFEGEKYENLRQHCLDAVPQTFQQICENSVVLSLAAAAGEVQLRVKNS